MRTGSLSKAGELVGSALGRLGARQRVLEQQAIANWGQVVGPQVGAASKADRLKDGILFVACKSSTWAAELTLHKDCIIKGINDSVGAAVVQDIRFSARGFKRSERARQGGAGGAINVEAVRLTEPEVQKAKQISQACGSAELAGLVEKAVLTGKRLAKLRSSKGS